MHLEPSSTDLFLVQDDGQSGQSLFDNLVRHGLANTYLVSGSTGLADLTSALLTEHGGGYYSAIHLLSHGKIGRAHV